MTYKDFKNQWLGKSIDFDHAYGKQCVDLIKQYIFQQTGVTPGSWGNAIDYWRAPNPQFLALYERVNSPRTGDIVVLKPVDSAPSHANGHIGLLDSLAGANINILEQNGSTGTGDGKGGNAIRVRAIPASRVVAYYRLKVKPAPMPTPNPTPSHPFAGLVGRTISDTEFFTAWEQGTDNALKYKLKGNYIVRGVSSRLNKVVVYSGANGKLVDQSLADRTGKYYTGWKVI